MVFSTPLSLGEEGGSQTSQFRGCACGRSVWVCGGGGPQVCESLKFPEGTPDLSSHSPDEPPRQCRYLWLVFAPQQVV